MHAQKHRVVVEVDASGNGVGYTPNVTGAIHLVSYVKDDYANGVDFTITLESTGESLWTDTNIDASEKVYPVAAANLGTTGAASAILQVPIVAVNDRVRIAIASGGVSTSGIFDVVVT